MTESGENLKHSEGDLGGILDSEGNLSKEEAMLSERVVEMAETEREKEVQVEKVVDVWSYKHAKLPCWWWLTALTLGPILLVLRLLVIAVLVINSFILVKLALLGNVDLDQPLLGWRRLAQSLLHFQIRLATISAGIWVKTKGKREDASKAPLLVVAP